MCGIVGLVGANTTPAHLAPMLDTIRSRGPDDTGHVSGSWFQLANCRLSIVALNDGHQPVSDSTVDIHVAFNGEIYNFRELQATLYRDHAIWASSEAELLLHYYRTQGHLFVRHLDGDFAIAVLDGRSHTCYLYRDPFGVKPLYYAYLGNHATWAFSSHLKSFFHHPGFATDLDHTALAERMVLHFWSHDRTCFANIHQLVPGHLLKLTLPCSNQHATIHAAPEPYTPMVFNESDRDNEVPNRDILAQCTNLLRASLQKRLDHSDISPTILALSGGIDSSLLSSLTMATHPNKVAAITIYDDPSSDDVAYASQLADALRLPHQKYHISLTTFQTEYPHMALELAGPHPSYAPYFLGRAIQESYPSSKVFLCGEGADEHFLGYPLFLQHDQYFTRSFDALQALSADQIEASSLLRHVQQWQTTGSHNLTPLLKTLFQTHQLVTSHLVPFDHGPMAHGIECRVPYLDTALTQYLATLPDSLQLTTHTTKVLLRLLLFDNLEGTPDLARALLTRRATPAIFSSIRCQNWLNQFLTEHFRNTNVQKTPIGRYATALPEIFWMGALATVYFKYRGKIDGLTFDEFVADVTAYLLQ